MNGDQRLTMMVMLRGGIKASLCPLFLNFQNKERFYLIKRAPDIIPRVCYRTGPRGWMDR